MNNDREKAAEIIKGYFDFLFGMARIDWKPEVHYNNNSYNVELENYSPAGENLIMDLNLEGDTVEEIFDSFRENLKEYRDNYDVDEHVDLWAGNRGKRGVPSSYSILVHDAEAIGDMLDDFVDKIDDRYYEFYERMRKKNITKDEEYEF